MTKRKIVYLNIDDVKPYWKNPRIHDIEPLINSIRDFGFNAPVVVDEEHTIIAGHGRLKAARALGLDVVPCVVVDLNEQDAKRYRIADNKAGEKSRWDMDNLISELREFETEDISSMGFTDAELKRMDLFIDEIKLRPADTFGSQPTKIEEEHNPQTWVSTVAGSTNTSPMVVDETTEHQQDQHGANPTQDLEMLKGLIDKPHDASRRHVVCPECGAEFDVI